MVNIRIGYVPWTEGSVTPPDKCVILVPTWRHMWQYDATDRRQERKRTVITGYNFPISYGWQISRCVIYNVPHSCSDSWSIPGPRGRGVTSTQCWEWAVDTGSHEDGFPGRTMDTSKACTSTPSPSQSIFLFVTVASWNDTSMMCPAQ